MPSALQSGQSSESVTELPYLFLTTLPVAKLARWKAGRAVIGSASHTLPTNPVDTRCGNCYLGYEPTGVPGSKPPSAFDPVADSAVNRVRKSLEGRAGNLSAGTLKGTQVFDSETRWFIRCDTCPDEPLEPAKLSLPRHYPMTGDRQRFARTMGWDVHDNPPHRCPQCVREGRTEMDTTNPPDRPDLDLTEAINTAAWDLDPVDGMEDEGRDGITQAIRAAAPVIERQVRERIAAEHGQELIETARSSFQNGYDEGRRVRRRRP